MVRDWSRKTLKVLVFIPELLGMVLLSALVFNKIPVLVKKNVFELKLKTNVLFWRLF